MNDDLDYADYIAIVSTDRVHMQQKLIEINANASHDGLKIYTYKKESLHIGSSSTNNFSLDGIVIENVHGLSYL